MKKYITILLFFVSLAAVSQQTPQYTQFVFNHFAHNPAVAGSKPCIDMRLGYRTQWVGFEGQPKTMWANIHGSIPNKKKKYLKTKHGFGIHAESDNTGPIGRTKLYVAYAYHVPLTHTLNLGMGFFGGFQQYRFDAGRVTLSNYNDNAIQGSSAKMIWPDFTPGLYLYSDKFFAGIAMWQLLRNKLPNLGPDSKLTHHFVLTGGKVFAGAGDWSYVPAAALKWGPMSKPAIDLNMLFDYRNSLIFGVSYRNTDAIAASFKVNFLKYFSLGYSFDFTTSKIRHASSNTHEIILGISACPHKGSEIGDCPVWN
ncbi:MAG: type IX secretion system membrane protein PorP/SprF [Bacteroidota bacterium]